MRLEKIYKGGISVGWLEHNFSLITNNGGKEGWKKWRMRWMIDDELMPLTSLFVVKFAPFPSLLFMQIH